MPVQIKLPRVAVAAGQSAQVVSHVVKVDLISVVREEVVVSAVTGMKEEEVPEEVPEEVLIAVAEALTEVVVQTVEVPEAVLIVVEPEEVQTAVRAEDQGKNRIE